MKLLTKIKNAKGILIALASAPAPTSEIMLADDGEFYLAAGRVRRSRKKGFVLKIVRRADRKIFPVLECYGEDSELTVDHMVRTATRIIQLQSLSASSMLKNLPIQEAPAHTTRRIVWDTNGKKGTAILLVGYCPQTLPYYLGLTADLLKTFPGADQTTIRFGHVTDSRSVKGFTVLLATVAGPMREVPGYTEWDSIDFNY